MLLASVNSTGFISILGPAHILSSVHIQLIPMAIEVATSLLCCLVHRSEGHCCAKLQFETQCRQSRRRTSGHNETSSSKRFCSYPSGGLELKRMRGDSFAKYYIVSHQLCLSTILNRAKPFFSSYCNIYIFSL